MLPRDNVLRFAVENSVNPEALAAALPLFLKSAVGGPLAAGIHFAEANSVHPKYHPALPSPGASFSQPQVTAPDALSDFSPTLLSTSSYGGPVGKHKSFTSFQADKR